jgi:hypothetical protein
MNRLFSLPENILSKIYEMDTTYSDKFQKDVKYEIFNSSWVRFRNKFLSNSAFTNEPIVSRKFELIFEYLQCRKSGYKSLHCDQITITSFWKRLVYNNCNISYSERGIDENEYELYVDIKFNTIPDSRGYSRRFECMVYTYSQFEDKDPSDWIRERNYCEFNVYKNSEFKIVQICRR